MISRYLASEYSRFFMLFLGAFVIMIFIGNVFGNLSIIFEDWEGFLRFLRKTALIMPQLMEFTIPITVLLATITTLSTLNRTSELLAIRASGVGPWNLAWPLLLVTLVIAAVTYFGQNYLSVWMQRQWTETASTENLQPIWKVGPDNKLYFFGKLPEKGKLESVTLFQWQTEPYRIVERTAIEKGEQQKTSWNFQDLQQYRFSENHLKLQNLDELNLKIEEVPSLKFEKAVSPRNLPLFELRNEISTETIYEVEDLINSIKNTPTSFQKTIAEVKINMRHFQHVVAQFKDASSKVDLRVPDLQVLGREAGALGAQREGRHAGAG